MKFKSSAISLLFALAAPALADTVELDSGHLFALDENGDGAVSKSEYDAFTTFAFGAIDTNGNGVLSSSEASAHLTADDFESLDNDANGSVTKSEFSAQANDEFSAADKDGDGALD